MRRDQQDSQQFWLAVLSAIRQAPGTAGEGDQLAATPDFNEAAISERVLSELAAHHDRTFLIIDDLHELTSAEALMQLTRLLEKLPQHVHAILATRRDLPLRLHKLRLAGELAEIRAADLRFTERPAASSTASTAGPSRRPARTSSRMSAAACPAGRAGRCALGSRIDWYASAAPSTRACLEMAPPESPRGYPLPSSRSRCCTAISPSGLRAAD